MIPKLNMTHSFNLINFVMTILSQSKITSRYRDPSKLNITHVTNKHKMITSNLLCTSIIAILLLFCYTKV